MNFTNCEHMYTYMLLKNGLAFCGSRILVAVYTVLFSSFLQVVVAQQTMPFNDLPNFETTGKIWRVAANCTKNLAVAETGLNDQRLRDRIMPPEISTERTSIATTIKAIGSKEKADTTHKPGTKVKRGSTNALHPKKGDAAKPTFLSIKPLLVKNTCISCHNENKRQVGPAFVEVAKRNYSVDEIVKLIHNPQPQHWPDYSTEMPPMPQVSVEEAKKIAAWIRSLGK